MSRKTIAVTGLNAVDNPGPGVPVLRSLKESQEDYQLIGFSYDVLEPGNFMDSLIDGSFIVPYPNSGPDILYQRIKYIHSHHTIDLIIPTLDSELENYIEIKEELNKLGIQLFLPQKEQLKMRDKTFLQDSLAGSEVLLPKTKVVQDAGGIRQATESLGFPVFVKGVFYEAYLARTPEEAIGYFYYLSAKWGIPVILQQVIYGEECNVAALANEGEMVSAVVMKKMFLTDKGKAWAGVTIQNQSILELSQKILRHIQWNSGCELEFVIEERSNQVFLLEINPRFPAWIYLATAAGQNMPDMLIDLVYDRKFNLDNQYEVGKVFVRHSWDDIVAMKNIESLSVRGELIHNKSSSNQENG